MLICFDLSHVFHAGASDVENAYALRILLDCLINLNRAYLKEYPNTTPLYESPVRYARHKVWWPIPKMYEEGFGDCKSLAAAFIAEKRNQGIPANPSFRWIMNKEGGRNFHILVLCPDGWHDPSKVKGMGRNENAQ